MSSKRLLFPLSVAEIEFKQVFFLWKNEKKFIFIFDIYFVLRLQHFTHYKNITIKIKISMLTQFERENSDKNLTRIVLFVNEFFSFSH